jgi:hypothetical protein
MNLFGQLAASVGCVVVMTTVHGLGVLGVTKLLSLEDRKRQTHKVSVASFALLTSIGLCLFALHLFEIGLFAAFYLSVGAIRDFEEALFYSASAYATVGQSDVEFPQAWRLVGAIEGLIGFLLIGWSTAVFITDMNKVLREDFK